MRNTSRLRSLALLRHEVDRYALITATAVFTLVTAAVATDGLDVPGGLLLLVLYPAGLVAADRLQPSTVLARELRIAAAWSALVLVAFALMPTFTATPLLAVGLPFALGLAVVIAKFPATATVVALLASGVIGSVQAFLGFGGGPVVDLILAGIWLVLLGRLVFGRPYEFAIWPAVVGCGLYVALTIIDMLTADHLGLAWFGFRTTVWYMLAFFAIAYAGWSRQTYRRIAIGFVAVTAAVAGYAVLRWAIGPAAEERALAVVTANGINVDPIDKTLRTVGSFLTGHQLAFWTGLMAPFCVAVALWVSGWRRFLAIGATALCILAMIASEARSPIGGFIVGVLVVLAIYQVSRAFPGFKAWLVMLAVGAVAALGVGAAALQDSDPRRFERYTNIVDPESDATWIGREIKWEQIIPAIEDRPFGHGLGTGGQGPQVVGDTLELSSIVIDNSFLMIAYEQGIFVLILFVAAILALFASIAIASIRTTSREAAALGMGACGALVSTMVSFYTGPYIEVPPVVATWLVVGLGLSYFVTREAPAQAPAAEGATVGGHEPRPRPLAEPSAI